MSIRTCIYLIFLFWQTASQAMLVVWDPPGFPPGTSAYIPQSDSDSDEIRQWQQAMMISIVTVIHPFYQQPWTAYVQLTPDSQQPGLPLQQPDDMEDGGATGTDFTLSSMFQGLQITQGFPVMSPGAGSIGGMLMVAPPPQFGGNPRAGKICRDDLYGQCNWGYCRFRHLTDHEKTAVQEELRNFKDKAQARETRVCFNDRPHDPQSCVYLHLNLPARTRNGFWKPTQRPKRSDHASPRTPRAMKICIDAVSHQCRRSSCRFLHPTRRQIDSISRQRLHPEKQHQTIICTLTGDPGHDEDACLYLHLHLHDDDDPQDTEYQPPDGGQDDGN